MNPAPPPYVPAPPQGPGGFSPVPAPPRGPGVQPPFPAPPVEGKGRRLGVSLGVAGGVLVLVCGGGVAALIGLGVSATSAITEQVHTAVGDYLEAVRDRDYAEAYDRLCDRAQRRETEAQFQSRVAAEEPISSFRLGEVDMVTGSVPVDVTYADGATARLVAEVQQDTGTGAFEVCSVAE